MRNQSVIIFVALLAGCRSVPMTERSQLMLSSEESENAQGVSAYGEYKAKYKVSSNAEYTAALQRCGEAIKKVAERDDFNWEFVLFDSPIENAFCLPGGKVAFYSGIVDKMNNEAEMAFVMAHEIAHAIARHGGEGSRGDVSSRLAGYWSRSVSRMRRLTTFTARVVSSV